MRMLSSLVVMCVTIVCVGCLLTEANFSINQGSSEAAHWDYDDLMQIRASLPKEIIEPDEELLVDVVVDNGQLSPSRLTFPTGCQITWIITAADGAELRPGHGCTQAFSSIEFDANGLFKRQVRIFTSRSTYPEWPFWGHSLPPGSYALEVYLVGFERRMDTETVWFEVVE